MAIPGKRRMIKDNDNGLKYHCYLYNNIKT